MDEMSITQGQHVIAGNPWHGLVRGNRLWVSPTKYRDGLFSASQARGSVRCAVPGVPPVSRTPTELAADAEAGISWRADAVMMLKYSGAEAYLYGHARLNGHALYATAPGNVFVVSLPWSINENASRTQLTNPATVTRFGRVSFAPETEQASVTVTLSGYETVSPNGIDSTLDMLPDGSRAIIGAIGYDADREMSIAPSPLFGFGLLKIGGAGTVGSPITAELQLLSGNDQFDTQASTPDDPQDDIEWREESTVEWLDDPATNGLDDLCPMSDTTVIRGYMDPINQVQTRNANVMGYILGWWFDDAGDPQAVTLDITYTRTITTTATAEGVGNPAQIRRQHYKYISAGPVCAPNGGSYSINGSGQDAFSYDWDGESSRATVEELEVVLRVAGAEVDRSLTRYEHQSTYTVTGSSQSLRTPPGAVYSRSERLLLNGTEIDSRTLPDQTDLQFGIGVVRSVLDPNDLFTIGGAPRDWLIGLARTRQSIDAGRPIVSRQPTWLSNHLVCLQETVVEYDGGPATINRYGFTAHPSGATSEKITSLVMQGAKPKPLYGARNPLTGEVLLGQTEKVTFI